MSTLQKWKLLSAKDVSPSPWFPLENRTYQMPNGKVVEDFYVTTVEDVGMVIPITKEGKLILARQYKPGADEITIEFPAGRMVNNQEDPEFRAREELREETGIIAEELLPIGKFAGFITKGTELIYCFLTEDVEITEQQHLDETENIEILQLDPEEFDQMITDGKILSAQCIAVWDLAKRKFPEIFSKK